MLWSLASLEGNEVEAINSLEEELEVNLLAFSGHEVELEDLSDEGLDKIKDLEEDLGVSLIAVKK